MQFTVGTSANFVLGQEFDINLGPPKIEISGPYSDHPGTVILCGVLSAVAIAWVLLYDALQEDQQRAALAIVFQMLVDALLATILGVELAMKAASRANTGSSPSCGGSVRTYRPWTIRIGAC